MKDRRNSYNSASMVLFIFLFVLAIGLLVFIFWPHGGYACEQTKAETEQYIIFRDTTYWAQEKDTGELAGHFSPCEQVETLPYQDGCGRIRGYLPGGFVIRVAARLKVMMLDDTVYGLRAADNTEIWIREDREKLAAAILAQENGEETEVSGGAVSLALIHCDGDTITERLCRSWDGYIDIGKAFFNTDITDGDMMLIVAFDWDCDGDLELCLVAASAPEEAKAAEPEKTEAKAQEQKESAGTGQQAAKKECWTLQIDFSLLLKHCVAK